MTEVEQTINFEFKLIIIAMYALAISLFVSTTGNSLYHILSIIPFIHLFFKYFKDFPWKKYLSAQALILIVIGFSISIAFNLNIIEHPGRHFSKLKYFIFPILAIPAYFELFQHRISKKTVSKLLYTFMTFTSLATLSGLIGLYTGYNPLRFSAACDPERNCGMYGMLMTYAHGIAWFNLLMLGMLKHSRIVQNVLDKRFLIITTLINLIGMYLTYTRGAFLAFIAALPFFLLWKRFKLFISILTFFTIVLGAISYIELSNIKLAKDETQEIYRLGRGNNESRLALYKTAYRIFLEKPLTGIGFNNFGNLVKDYKIKFNIKEDINFKSHAHNNYFEILADTGLLGFIPFIFFFLFWFIEMLKRRDILGDIVQVFIIGFAGSGLTQSTIVDSENLFFVFIVYVISLTVPHIANSHQEVQA
ncbi:MAG: O-antigen ligase family protein [Halobacteriovoraceae bacterium]|nr:O-antigen ligase family protein [Halobacteriovoraceae bacterium]